MKILFIGDIIGRPGRAIIKEILPGIKLEFNVDLTIANAENVAGFRGLDEKSYRELETAGIEVFTSGNHIWSNKSIFPFLKTEKNIVVPANFPSVHGSSDPMASGMTVFDVAGEKVAVFNLQGRIFMEDINCPFTVADEILDLIDNTIKIRIVDFHAEATSEKRAMGHYLDGRVSAVIGTHTHIQTADEEILSGGTAYLTDVGMTGPRDSVIGIRKDIIIKRFLTGVPQKFEVSKLDPVISFAVFEIDGDGRAISIERFIREVEL